MKINARLDRPRVQFDKDNTVNMMVSLEAPPLPADFSRNPVSIVTVLDRSGSMCGAKLDALKQTMYLLVDNLTGADKLGVVWFDDQLIVWDPVRMTSDNRKKLKADIAKVQVHGDTNISQGMDAAYKMLGERGEEGMAERMLVLTDGQVNRGLSTPEQFLEELKSRRKGIGVTCLGYGDGYNDNLLRAISSSRGGGFYFVEGTDMLAEVFGEELGGLLSMYASDISVKLSLGKGVDPASVTVLNDFPTALGAIGEEPFTLTVSAGNLMFEESKAIMVRFVRKAEQSVPGLPETVATIKVTAKSSKAGEALEAEGACPVGLVEAKDVSQADKEIEEKVLLLDAAKAQLKAKQEAESGHIDVAQGILDILMEDLEKYGTDNSRNYAAVVRDSAEALAFDSAKATRSLGVTAYTTSTYRGGGTQSMKKCFAASNLGSFKNKMVAATMADFEKKGKKDDDDPDTSTPKFTT